MPGPVRRSSAEGDPDLVTSLVDLAEAGQSIAVDQFRLLRLETAAELKTIVAWAAVVGPIAGLVLAGSVLLLAGIVVALQPLVGLAWALVDVGLGVNVAAGLAAWLGARWLGPAPTGVDR